LAAAASPTSATNLYLKESQTLGGTSGSDSDSESLFDIEGGPCEQSTNPQDVKRMRRYTKNMNNVFLSIFFSIFLTPIALYNHINKAEVRIT
jgi:hypothetical protein